MMVTNVEFNLSSELVQLGYEYEEAIRNNNQQEAEWLGNRMDSLNEVLRRIDTARDEERRNR